MKKLSDNWHSGKEKLREEAKERGNKKIIGKSWSEKYQKEIIIYAGPSEGFNGSMPVGFGREYW